jgi:hypothetical protein
MSGERPKAEPEKPKTAPQAPLPPSGAPAKKPPRFRRSPRR